MTTTTNAHAVNLESRIADIYKELVMREQAAAHLRGIPARQNQTAIDRLYDTLNALHIEHLEAAR